MLAIRASCRMLLALSAIGLVWGTQVVAQPLEDNDQDGIRDAEESRLLSLYAPLFILDTMRSEPREGVAVPSTVARAIQHCVFRRSCEPDPCDSSFASVDAALAWISSLGDYGASANMRHVTGDYRWGWSDLPGGSTSWPDAIANNNGLYARAWRPWRGTGESYADVISLQYFIYLTWNETSISGEIGNHEGDWICADIAIDPRANPLYPTILHAVVHNHGRQHFLEPRAIEFREGHPVFYLENGVHELWPNAGEGSASWSGDSWPQRDGFATNYNFDHEGTPELASEAEVCRDHLGEGNEWRTWQAPIKNIGGYDPIVGDGELDPWAARSLCGAEGLFILKFKGRWGDRHGPVLGEPPKGPPFEGGGKMWSRLWKINVFGSHLGPWAGERAGSLIPGDTLDPFQYPFSSCVAGPGSYSFCLWTTSGLGGNYGFSVPSRPSVGQGLAFYVDERGSDHVEGTSVRPYGSLQQGLLRVPQGSELRLLSNSTGFSGSISRQLTLKAPMGTVTIGQ